MSRLNTMYSNDEFLKDISNVIGKVDSKNETQIKKEIEQVGYKEFCRYYKEKDIYIKQLQQENQKCKEVIDKAIDLIEKSVTTDIGIDSNNNLIHYHQLTEDETGELLDILKEVK